MKIQTVSDMNILRDVLAVIEVEELMMHDPHIQQQSGNRKDSPSSAGLEHNSARDRLGDLKETSGVEDVGG